MSNLITLAMIDAFIAKAKEPLEPYVVFIPSHLYQHGLGCGWNMDGLVVSGKLPSFEVTRPAATATTEGVRDVLERINKEFK